MKYLKGLISLALKEDIGNGDITSCAIIPRERRVTATIKAKEDIVLSGIGIAAVVFEMVDKKIRVTIKHRDGDLIKNGGYIAVLHGPAIGLLAAERTALNFLQHLSGIATMTRRFVEKAKGSGVRILDTRKTTPGWRLLEKYAVRAGGGTNHRMGLFDMYLIKNNHIDAAGSITEAVLQVKKERKSDTPIEVEVRNRRELREAVVSGADIIMLDNFSISQARHAVNEVLRLCKKLNINSKLRPKIEVSGKVNLKNVRGYAKTGIDFISVGAITHSSPAVDIHMVIGKDRVSI